MSNFAAIVVMLVLVILVFFACLGAAKWCHNRAEIVIFGQSAGVPVSIKHRQMLLQINYLSWVILAATVNLIAAIAFVALAQATNDPSVRMFAYMCAWFEGAWVLGWPVSVAPWFLYMLSVLRQAEAD